jgi:hypothetical protein
MTTQNAFWVPVRLCPSTHINCLTPNHPKAHRVEAKESTYQCKNNILDEPRWRLQTFSSNQHDQPENIKHSQLPLQAEHSENKDKYLDYEKNCKVNYRLLLSGVFVHLDKVVTINIYQNYKWLRFRKNKKYS